MPSNRLADIVLIVHLLWVLGVLLPIPLMLIGALRGWRWIRSYRLRIAHLLMISIVVAESLLGLICPLTLWEQALRSTSQQSASSRPFVEYWISRILFYDFPGWVFTSAYVAIGLFILALFRWIPPHSR